MGGTPGIPPVPTPSAAAPGPHPGPTPGPDGLGKSTPEVPVTLKGRTAVLEAMADNSAVKALAEMVTDAKFDRQELTLTVSKADIVAACEAVKAAGYTFFEDVTAVDWYPQEPRFQLSYHILSHSLKQRIRLAVLLNSTDLNLNSITQVW